MTGRCDRGVNCDDRGMPEPTVTAPVSAAPVWWIPGDAPDAGSTVHGRADGPVWKASGIRYAHAQRLQTPQLAPLASGDIDATRLAPSCPQVSFPLIDEVLDEVEPKLPIDEDCLHLSITVPAGTAPDAGLPVMVWIHGGSYVTGAGDLPIYDPTALVTEHQVVVVTVTYRLGLFGYLRHAASPGNLGLLDQRTALEWVQRYIAHFGGDPANVTAFGESAGGDSVAHLMIADGARGLFRRAIVMSAPLGLMPGRDKMYAAMADKVHGLSADASVEEMLERTNSLQRMSIRYGLRAGMPFGPQYGVAPLPAEDDLDDAWSHVAPDVDLLIGHTAREAALFVPPRLGRVPLRPAARERLVRRLGNSIYDEPARRFAQRHAAAGGSAATYLLHADSHDDPRGGLLAGAHTTDLPYVFPGPAWETIVAASGPAWHVTPEAGREVRAMLGGFARNGVAVERSGPPVVVRSLV